MGFPLRGARPAFGYSARNGYTVTVPGLVSVLLLVGSVAGSQPTRAQDVGKRVRVTAEDGVVSTGQVWASRAGSLELLLDEGRPHSYTREEIVLLERSLGTRRQWKHDGDLAAAIGHGMGFGLLGALYGSGVGLLIRREAWETIPHATPGDLALRPLLRIRTGRDGGSTTYFGIRIQF